MHEHTAGTIDRQAWATARLQTALIDLERLGRPLNAVVAAIPDPPRAPEGPLLGTPVAVKDMIDVAGHPRGNGNPDDMAGPPAGSDAPVVQLLRSAGADVFALSALLEYAAGAQHPDLPEARNPVVPERTAGGSSGGSAALVGAGVCPAAIGTDTGGSIRLPAHYCAVVGLKPTYGTIPVEGVQPLSPTLDHVGVIGEDVAATARVFLALTGNAPVAAPDTLRIGVLTDQLADPRLDKDVRVVVVDAIDRLRDVAVLVDRDSGALDVLNGVIGDIIHYEAWQVHGAAMTARPGHFGAPTARLFAAAAAIDEERYRHALAERSALLAPALTLLDGLDLLIGPAAPYTAPVVSPPGDTPEGAIEGIFTAPYNVTGQPAIVIPCGATLDGLPVGLQLAAAPGQDALLLAAAAVVECALATR
ncbi:amidase [Diaminobutyricibacter sp. McL0618]|uniref:amidase n=1 Tax=Leifsonia sp. McL0618 TaxID=3415677 RepID=UPI003CEDF8F8